MVDLIPSSLLRLSRFPSMWDDEDDWGMVGTQPTNLSIAEDEKHVYIEAAVPGLDPDDIEVTFDKGILWIKGEAKEVEEDKKKKFYRRASTSVSYRILVPGEIDATIEPQASTKNGVMKVSFTKSPKSQPKKIAVKKSEK